MLGKMQASNISLQVPLIDQETLIINYKQLVDEHNRMALPTAEKQADANSIENLQDRIVNTSFTLLDAEEKKLEEERKRRKTRWDNQDEYEHEFIDDSELVQAGEDGGWEWGYFAWQGDLEKLFDSGEGKIEDKPVTSHAISVITKKPVEVRPKLKKKTPLDAQMTDDDVVEEPALTSSTNNTNLPATTPGSAAAPASTKKKPGPKKGTKRKSNHSGDPASSSSKIAPPTIDTPKPTKSAPVVTEKKESGTENPLGPLPTLIMEKLDILREEASKADFTEKKNFPVQLKPLFSDAVTVAMDLQLLNSTFWDHIINILPYNAFTMKKLASRLVFPERMEQFKQELTKAYDKFQVCVEKGIKEQGSDKFRFDENLKTLIWTILCLEWEIADIENRTKVLAKQPEEYQENGVRRAVYQKMAAYWPNQAMETTILSTIYSQFKKKREKSQDADGWQYQEESPYGLIRVDPYSKSIPKPRKSTSMASTPSTVIVDPALEVEKNGAKRKSLGGGGDVSKKIKKEKD